MGKAHEIMNALFGLTRMGDSEELMQLFAALIPKVEKCDGQLPVHQVNDVLHSFSSLTQNDEVQQLIAALRSKVQDSSSLPYPAYPPVVYLPEGIDQALQAGMQLQAVQAVQAGMQPQPVQAGMQPWENAAAQQAQLSSAAQLAAMQQLSKALEEEGVPPPPMKSADEEIQ